MAENDVIYLDGIKRTLAELGVDHKSLVNSHRLLGKVVPFILNDEMRSLYNRALKDKGSLTSAEQNRVLGRMPPDEEEKLCQNRLGCSRQHLYDKALERPSELTSLECDMIVHGFDYDWRVSHDQASSLERMKDMSREDRSMVMAARSELQDAAFMKASAKGQEYSDARSAEARSKRNMIRAARTAPRPKWLEEMADRKQRWGFVVIRTAENDLCDARSWQKLQAYYTRECARVFQFWNWNRHPDSDLSQTQESLFIWEPALDGASTATLRAWFIANCELFPEGVRRDCFLVADEDSLAHESILNAGEGSQLPTLQERNSITLRAVDPNYDAAKAPVTVDYGYDSTREPITEADLEGFVGEVRVPVHKVFDWLYYTLAKDTESWEDRYKQTTQRGPQSVLPYWPYPAY